MKRYTPFRLGVATVGAGVITTDTSLNVANQLHQAGGQWNDLVTATIVAAIAVTVLASAAWRAFTCSGIVEKISGLLMIVAILAGSAFTFQQSVERYTTVREAFFTAAAEEEAKKRMAKSTDMLEVQQVDRLIEVEEEAAASECIDNLYLRDDAGNVRVLKNVRYEAGSPYAQYFKNCPLIKTKLANLQAERTQMMGRILALNEIKPYEMDKSAALVARTFGLDAEPVSMYLNWLLPLTLLFSGMTMFAWGTSKETFPDPEPEFDLGLKGDQALVNKTERYAVEYHRQNDVWPAKADMSEIAGLSPQRCETILKRCKERLARERRKKKPVKKAA